MKMLILIFRRSLRYYCTKNNLTEWNLHDVILNLNDVYIQSFFSIKKRDRHTQKQTNPIPPQKKMPMGPLLS